MNRCFYFFFVLLLFLSCGSLHEYTCRSTNQVNVEYLWCPKLDSVLVDWMPSFEKRAPYYKNMADCATFKDGYTPQHEFLKPCDVESNQEKFQSRAIADIDSFDKKGGILFIGVTLFIYADYGTAGNYHDRIGKISFDIYGCSAFECNSANKIHMFIEEGISYYNDGKKISYDQWLFPENFKIEKTDSKSRSSDFDYYRYYHFRLNIDSPTIKAIVKFECDSVCYDHWNSFSVPLGG